MSTEQITAEAMALPLPDRLSLVQALWRSIDAGLPDSYERDVMRETARHERELSIGKMGRRDRGQAMNPVRGAVRAVARR
jgi:hypothetical protein